MTQADRRALIKQYKDTPRPAGVGAIRNSADGRTLVISSTDIPALLNRHRAQLSIGSHPHALLQRDWSASGGEGFTFDVLDLLTPPDDPAFDPTDDLRVLEAMWVENLRTVEPSGYNRAPR
jgi:hypothetical protein